jgi:hypothetical protein
LVTPVVDAVMAEGSVVVGLKAEGQVGVETAEEETALAGMERAVGVVARAAERAGSSGIASRIRQLARTVCCCCSKAMGRR